MARDLSSPLASTFGPGDKVGAQRNAPNSGKIGKALSALGLAMFGGNIALNRGKRKAAKNEAKRKNQQTKERKAKFLKKNNETVKTVGNMLNKNY